MKQIIFTFEKEEDYNEFNESLVKPLSEKVGKVEENDKVVYINIQDLKGDTK